MRDEIHSGDYWTISFGYPSTVGKAGILLEGGDDCRFSVYLLSQGSSGEVSAARLVGDGIVVSFE